MKAIIIARVSTMKQEKEGLSLTDIQLPLLRKYAQENGMTVVEEFIFSETADSKIRKKFNEVVTFVKKHSEIKAVIAFRVDRITRNYRDAVLCDDLRLEYDKELHFVHDRLIIHKNSVGRDIQDWDLKVFLAKQYLNRLKEDAVNSATTLLRMGKKPGKAPIGHKNVTEPDGKTKNIIPDPIRAPYIKKIFELYATGNHSYGSITEVMKNSGLTSSSGSGKPLTKSQIEVILNDHFYYGKQHYNGQLYDHCYERLISKWLFDKCQSIILSRANTNFKNKSKPFSLRGIVVCDYCGCQIGLDIKKDKYHYLFCNKYRDKSCPAPRIHEGIILGQINTEVIQHLDIPDDAVLEVKDKLRADFETEKDFSVNRTTVLLKSIQESDQQIDLLYHDRRTGRITTDKYDKLAAEEQEKIAKWKEELTNHEDLEEEFVISSSYLLDITKRIPEIYESSKAEQKRQIHQFVLSNCKLQNKKLLYDLNMPFDAVVCCSKTKVWLPRLDSNQQPPR